MKKYYPSLQPNHNVKIMLYTYRTIEDHPGHNHHTMFCLHFLNQDQNKMLLIYKKIRFGVAQLVNIFYSNLMHPSHIQLFNMKIGKYMYSIIFQNLQIIWFNSECTEIYKYNIHYLIIQFVNFVLPQTDFTYIN